MVKLLTSQMVDSGSSAISYLNLLLDYHSKTRTIPLYTRMLFLSFSQRPTFFSDGSQNFYQLSSSSPLLRTAHLDRLGKYVQAFLTPSQVAETVNIIEGSLRDTSKRIPYFSLQGYNNNGDHCKQRIKLDANTDGYADSAVAFSLSIRVASVVLAMLPFQSVPESGQRDIRRVLDELQATFIHAPINDLLKIVRERGSRGEWAAQVVMAAILRLWYTLNGTRYLPYQCDPKVMTKLLDASKDHEVIPELSVELVSIFPTCLLEI